MIGAQAKSLNYSPTNVGIVQQYWQSLSYLPSTAQAGSDKLEATVLDVKTQAMPRAWRKSLRRLYLTTRSDPTLLANNK